MTSNPNQAVFGPQNQSIHIKDMTVDDPTVVRVVAAHVGGDDSPEVAGIVDKLLSLGAVAADVVGDRHDVEGLRLQLDDAVSRTENAVAKATDHSTVLAERVGQQLDRARQHASTALTEAATASAKQLAEIPLKVSEDVAKRVAGIDAAATGAVQDAVAKVMAEVQTSIEARMTKVVADVDRQWDPRVPTSPVAQMTAALKESHQQVADVQLGVSRELIGKVDELKAKIAELTVRTAVTTKTASVTPLKGATYEDAVHAVLEQVAATHGDDYRRTGNQPGALGASKKGDAVQTVVDIAGGEPARIVIEMHNGDRPRDWSGYLDEARRNRQAVAALGIVRTADQVPGGSVLRMWGTRQVVMAFDPEVDDTALVQAVIMLLRAQACLAAARSGDEQLHTAREQLAAAATQLEQFAEVEKLTTTMKANADKVTTKVASMRESLTRHVTAALQALHEVRDTDGDTAQTPPGAAA